MAGRLASYARGPAKLKTSGAAPGPAGLIRIERMLGFPDSLKKVKGYIAGGTGRGFPGGPEKEDSMKA